MVWLALAEYRGSYSADGVDNYGDKAAEIAVLAGSFVGFLTEKYGLAMFHTLYETGSYGKVYMKSLPSWKRSGALKFRNNAGENSQFKHARPGLVGIYIYIEKAWEKLT